MQKPFLLVPLVCLCARLELLHAEPPERPLHRSLAQLIAVANISADVGLSREKRRHITAVLRSVRQDRVDRAIRIEQDILNENETLRKALEELLTAKQLRSLNRAAVHYYFEILRPDLAFDWLQIELTQTQREQLQSIKIDERLQDQLDADYLAVLVDYLELDDPKRLGEPFEFRSTLLQQRGGVAMDLYPNIEPLHVLGSSYVQSELGCTIDQSMQIKALAKEYRTKGLVFRDHREEEPDLDEDQLDEIRQRTIDDCEALLAEEQLPRFRQIVLQRYLRYPARYALLLAKEYVDEDKLDREFKRVARRMPLEVAAVRRLRLVQFVAKEVAEIMVKVDVERLVGQIGFNRALDFVTVPKLDNIIASKLAHRVRPVNPRRTPN